MNIKYAILGFLSWNVFSGYDMKKLFMDSSYFYWSGNNNQIYTTLVQLLKSEMVTAEIIYQEGAPNRKVYSITDKGRQELQQWVSSTPALPQIRNAFLIQLAWADQLGDEALSGLIDDYEQEIKMQLVMQAEKEKRGIAKPERTEREIFLWNMITKNWENAYQRELDWIKELREGLQTVDR